MGLNISYGKNLKVVGDAKRDEDGELENYDLRQFYINPDFPGREGQVSENVAYDYDDADGFRAGSYGGYNGWRNELAKLAGYKESEYENHGASRRGFANTVFCNPVPGPFMELINFSDCEGVIGAKVSKKLAKDFAEFNDKAINHENERFVTVYKDFKKAFECAAENGFVDFH